MKRFLALLFASVLSVFAQTWAPPATGQGEWTVGQAAGTPGGTGIPGGIDQYLAGGVNDRAVTGTVRNVTAAPYNADSTGVVSANAAVAAAYAAANPGDVIYFPPGTYRFDSRALYIQNKDNVTIRGAGSGSVTFVIATTQSVFQFGSPGIPDQSPKIVTGTKTKGTRTLTVDETSLYTVGDHVSIAYENEVNNARIQAGAPPVWTSLGWPEARRMYARVTGKTGTTVTIDPALPADATNLELKIYRYALAGQNWITSGVGFEGFSVSYASSSHPPAVIAITAAEYCWVYDVKFLNWSMNTANGSAIGIGDSYRCEIRKCVFTAAPSVSSDGAIGFGSMTSSAIYDNIITGGWGTWIYDNGNSFNNVYAYNYAPDLGSDLHNAHPMLNLVEGNYAYNHVADGYHGSSSDNTVYGNYFYGGGTGLAGWYSLMLHRFTRRHVVARNFFGQDGVNAARIMWGQPNFNLDANGFAGPTGLSNQVGQVDRSQPGYAPNTYVIQAGDVAVGDFWSDWETSATLTTRVSNTVGIFTVSGGTWFTGDAATGGRIWPRVWWNNKSTGMGAIGSSYVTAVAGNSVTMDFGSGSLPAELTAVKLYQGPGGWQERDLDVQASSTVTHNYFAAGTGTGAIQNSSGSTFPASLAWSAKPAWFGSKPWPVFNVDSAATADVSRLPAAHRAINGNEDYLGGAATPQYSPAPGTYGSAQTVTITTGSPAPYTIYYTIDGSTPTTSSLVYSSPVTLPGATTTLKAITVKSGLSDSSVQSGTYTIGGVPNAPSSLGATQFSSSQINLAWTDNSNNETGFRIESRVGTSAWGTVTTTAAGATTYNNTGLTASTTYDYRVFAINGSGDSTASNTASATTQPESGGGGGGGGAATIQTLNIGTLNIQ